MKSSEEYLILSKKWSGKNGEMYATWYRPESKGYVQSIDHAGIFTKEDADDRDGGTMAVLKSDAIKLSILDDHETVPAHYLPVDRIDKLPRLLDEWELLPCPFCGGKAEIMRRGTGRVSMQIQCQECGCEMETSETFLGPHCSWNTRVEIK